jgi:spermidine synthase
MANSNMLQQAGREHLWLLPLFIGSGCSALIYEIVWFQSLQMVVGASAVSLAVLLTIFMGGMCLGSLLYPKLMPTRWHPLAVYATLEFLIGVMALALLFALPSVERFYVEQVGVSHAGVLLRAVVAGCCLLPPTLLMGATLPAIARWFENNQQGTARIGMFYSANIFGAVVGCLFAAFYLLRLYDILIATYVAVGINFGVAVGGWVLSVAFPNQLRSESTTQQVASAKAGWSVSHWVIALSGFSALGAEVVWTRELSLMLGASVYTFSLILAVFLIGLGIGSGFGAAWARNHPQPGTALAWCQVGAALCAAWAAWMMAKSLPYWPIDPSLSSSPWFGFQLDIVRVMWAVFPAALCWGTSFPLALAHASRGGDPAKLVASVYAANTLGAILGALLFTWIAIPRFGILHSQQFLISAPLVGAVLLLAFSRKSGREFGSQRFCIAIGAMASLVFVAWLPAPPSGLAAYGRYLVTWNNEPNYLYNADGLSASIAVSEFDNGVRNFHVSGKVVASSEPQDMRLQRMLGHLPALICKDPKSILVVGCGAAVTAGTFVVHPSVERIVICEIEPLIPAAAGNYFGMSNHEVIKDPRVEIIFDDARHFMLVSKEKFDVITSDPIHPWVKGAAALYSKEYFDLCKEHLKPGGVITQWVPLYESSLPAVKSEVATFFASFPHGSLWCNDDNGNGYDMVMLAKDTSEPIDLDALEERLGSRDHERVAESLAEVQMGSMISLVRCYAGRNTDMTPWLADAVVNTNRNLRLQYLAGWALNARKAAEIRDSFRPFAKFPKDFLVGRSRSALAVKYILDPDRNSNTP